MKMRYFAALLLALLLALGASAQALAEETAQEGAFRDAAPEEGIFQNGSFSGPQTIPGEPMAVAESWEDAAYQALLGGWRSHASSISLRSLRIPYSEISAFWDVCHRVLNDHPELFYGYNNGHAYSDGTYLTSVEFVYRDLSVIGTTLDQAIRDFDAAVDEAMSQIQGVTNEVEKALLLHDWLVTRCAYNWEIAWELNSGPEASTAYVIAGLPYTAYGPLVGRDAVCQGYALAYKYLLNRAGIGSIYLSSRSMNHGWNGVMIGGRWYHVDATWDDSTPNKEGHCGHEYFLLSDSTISDTSHGHNGWDRNLITCNDTSYESGWAFLGSFAPFYRRNGLYYYTRPVNDNGGSAVGVNAVFRNTSLQTANEVCLTAELGRGIWRGGAVWLDGRLYLAPYFFDGDGSRLALVYDLDTGLTAQAALVPFTASPSPNGQYNANTDRNLGLRYNAKTREIEAISCTRREVVFSFPAVSLPSGWSGAQVGTSGAGVASGLSPDGTAAAVLWGSGSSLPSGLTLWAAFYNGSGKLLKCQMIDSDAIARANISNLRPGMVLAYLDPPSGYTAAKLMLLTADKAPVCAAG